MVVFFIYISSMWNMYVYLKREKTTDPIFFGMSPETKLCFFIGLSNSKIPAGTSPLEM